MFAICLRTFFLLSSAFIVSAAILDEDEIKASAANAAIPFADELTFEATGATFAAMLTVSEDALIEWTFADGTTSDSATPFKDYASNATRYNRLKVTPWSALIEINIGYDAGDGGPDTIAFLDQQNVIAVHGMQNIAPYLRVWASSHNPHTALDFSNFVSLTEIECFLCQELASVSLRNTPLLARACFEDNNLDALDLSESPSLADLRGAVNAYTAINWGTTGANVWHICVRDNPQMTANLPDMSQFPLLQELFIWNDSQTGTLHPTSTHLTMVLADANYYTAADFTGTFPEGRGGTIEMRNNNLASLIIDDCPGLSSLDVSGNQLNRDAVDGVLGTLDSFGTNGGVVRLMGNAGPSDTGQTFAQNLMARGWTVNTEASEDDSTPPIFSAISVLSDVTSAAIAWVTNENASTTLEYGETLAYGGLFESDLLTLQHFVPIGALSANSTYHFRLLSRDAVGNTATSADYSFTTRASGTLYWEDNFHRADGAPGNGWTGVNDATAQIVGNLMRRTDSGAYRILYNPAGENLPADCYVTMVVPNATIARNWWGLIGRYLPGEGGMGSGNKVFWMSGGATQLGVGHAGFDNDIAIAETGGYPPSWQQNLIHTVTLGYAGETVTVYLDGQEFGHFTDATNNRTGTGVGFVGDGVDSPYNIFDIKVTDYLPGFTPATESGGEGGIHSADTNDDNKIQLQELLRLIQFFNMSGYACDTTETTLDGYAPGTGEDHSCSRHASDFDTTPWKISLQELLRLIQFFNMGGYYACPDQSTPDGYCPGIQL